MPNSDGKFFIWLAENSPPGGWTDEQRELIRAAWNGGILAAARVCDHISTSSNVDGSAALRTASNLIRDQFQ